MLSVNFLAAITAATGFQVLINTNTYNATELEHAATNFRCNGTWSSTPDSPSGVTAEQWRSALQRIGPHAISQDRVGAETRECLTVPLLRATAEPLLAAFVYHESGARPHTMLTAAEIEEASSRCGNAKVIILTRAYGQGAWKTNVEKVLQHPLLYGVALEFSPIKHGRGFLNEGVFVKEVLAAGKNAFFLLPFQGAPDLAPAEERIKDVLVDVASQGADLQSPRVSVVLSRYFWTPPLPVAGPVNSIEAALREVQKLQRFTDRLESSSAVVI